MLFSFIGVRDLILRCAAAYIPPQRGVTGDTTTLPLRYLGVLLFASLTYIIRNVRVNLVGKIKIYIEIKFLEHNTLYG